MLFKCRARAFGLSDLRAQTCTRSSSTWNEGQSSVAI